MLLTSLVLASASFGEQDSTTPEIQGQCRPEGYLRVALYGSIRATLDWIGPELECSGMPRPAGAGGRLHFSAATDSDNAIRDIEIIISLPELKPGQTVVETPVNITVMESHSSRFFSSGAASFCLGDIVEQAVIVNAGEQEFSIQGILYCVAALPELNGKGSVTITDLKFSGQIDWQVPQ